MTVRIPEERSGSPDHSRKRAVFHLVHYGYAQPSSPAYPRADYLVRELRLRGYEVNIWAYSDRKSETKTGQYGEKIEIVADPGVVMLNGLAKLFASLRKKKTKSNDDSYGSARLSIKEFVRSNRYQPFLYPDDENLWSRRVAWKIGGRLRPGDVVFTCSRPESVGYIGVKAIKRGCKWWFDLADGWMWQGFKRRGKATPARIKREENLEKTWIKSAHRVSTVNESLKKYFDGLRPSPDVFIYPNLIPRELNKPGWAPKNRASSTTGVFTILHFGRLRKSDPSRTLAPLLRQLESYGEGGVRPRFVFYGDFNKYDMEDISRIKSLGFDVEVSETASRETLFEIVEQKKIDAFLVVNSEGALAGTSKLLDAVGLGLKTLVFSEEDSEAAKVAEESGLGVVINFGDNAMRLENAIMSLLRLPARVSADWPVRKRHDGYQQAAALVDEIEKSLF